MRLTGRAVLLLSLLHLAAAAPQRGSGPRGTRLARADNSTSSESWNSTLATATSAASTLLSTTSSPSVATVEAAGAPCSGNSAADRSAWCEYSISTDYYNDGPDTGVTREYWFVLQQVTVAPDGYPRTALTVNGTIPGPTIEADWGDTIVVHVQNELFESTNGTSIHFHGIRQHYSNQMDGVSSITQCPTAPGDSYT
ncbi:MAG: multicopper oxidase domain-containing protein [Terriglobus roseus]|nr:multicopper oxidase domain-containing protein [Terriglobus roseus]